MAEQHIVEKVKVDVDVDSLELAEKIKLEINDFIQNEVLSIIEAYFNELNLPPDIKDKTIQLDKVQLSVDASSWNVRSRQLKQGFRKEVEKQMNPIIEKLKENNLKRDPTVSKGYDDIKEETAQVYSKEERVLKSLFHFLDHGTLPWWVKSVEESRELFSEDSLITALREQSALAKKELQKRRKDRGVTKRLVQQFPTSVVSEMIQTSLSVDLSQREKVTTAVIEEIKLLPKDVSSRILQLLIELSSPRNIDEVFRNGSISKLFKHIHSQFFDAALSQNALESTLNVTHAMLRILHFFRGKESELIQMKSEFQKSLEIELSSDVFVPLKKTKAYQKMFFSPNSVQEDIEDIELLSSKGSSNKDKQFTDNLETLNKEEGVEIDPVSQVEKKNTEIDPDQEATLEDFSVRESAESKPKVDEEKSAQIETSIESEELDDTTNSDKTLKNESSESMSSKENDPSQGDDTLDENVKSIEGKPNSSVQNEDNPSETASRKDKDDSTSKNNVDNVDDIGRKEMEKSDDADMIKRAELQSNRLKEDLAESEARKSEARNGETSASTENEKNLNSKTSELGEILKKRTEDLSTNDKKIDAMPNQLFVENAGLVLLNPFIIPLFKQLELLTEDGKLTEPDLAACILHYAATGREGDFEFEMTFEKYLCGIPPTVSIDKEIRLTEKHKKEVENVLNSVLEHWRALKSKSTGLLQNEFLSRSGKLFVEKSNHRLIIERKTFDILLDKLPWSYSLIKFSWKKELMFVEW